VISERSVSVLGVPVGAFTMSSLLAAIEHLMDTPGCSVACGVNAYTVNLACSQSAYRRTLLGSDLLYADGASILMAARCLGERLPQKLSTSDVWPSVCELLLRHSYGCYFLGGKLGLAERVAALARTRYPDLRIVGTHHGYFNMDDDSVVSEINAAHPDIVWVGMGEPRQARWAESARPRLQARLVLTCGGMFSVLCGDIRRPPRWWCDRGFEWVCRLIQQPCTWQRYLVGLPVFGLRVLGQALLDRRPGHTEQPIPYASVASVRAEESTHSRDEDAHRN